MSQFRFSVIIPVFNKWDLTKNCLESLALHTKGLNYEVIIVDNASSDDTATRLGPLCTNLFASNFRVIRQSSNINFGPACNAGALAAKAPLLFFLNNDTILTPNWYIPLEEELLRDDNTAIVGPLLLYENNTVQHLGVSSFITRLSHTYSGIKYSCSLARKRRVVGLITGAAILIRTKDFLDIGMFYKRYINGFEDIDLCISLKVKGKKFVCTPKSIIYHLESQTPGRISLQSERVNASLLTQRHGPSFIDDLHRVAADDGLEVYLNSKYHCFIRETDATSARLLAELNKDYSKALDLLEEHPFWEEGYRVTSNLLFAANQYELAYVIAMKIFINSLDRQDLKVLCKIACKSKIHKLIEDFQTIEASYALWSSEEAMKTALNLVKDSYCRALKNQDEELQKILLKRQPDLPELIKAHGQTENFKK